MDFLLKVYNYLSRLQLKRDQLAYDLSIVASIFLYQILTWSTGKSVSQMFNPTITYIMCMAFLLMLSLSCGYLHMRYSRQNRFFGFAIIFVTVLLMMFPLNVLGKLTDVGNAGIIATFVGATGFVLGRIVYPDKMALTIERYVMLLILVPASVALIFWMIGFTGKDGYKGVLICVLGFAAVAFLGLLIHRFFKKTGNYITRISQTTGFKKTSKILVYFFWSITAFAVCTWQEVLADAPENSGFHRLFMLTLSGIIPYRILWAFSPPRNMATTILAGVVVLISLISVYLG